MPGEFRVGYFRQAFPPFSFDCAIRGNFSRFDTRCRYPGIEVEILHAIASYLNMSFVPAESVGLTEVDPTSLGSKFATILMLIPGPAWRRFNLSHTTDVYSEAPAVIMTDRPQSIRHGLWSVAGPFSWQVWMALIGIVLVNRCYAIMFTTNKQWGMMVNMQRIRYAFTPNLLPITLAVMLFTSLYRSGLLTKLLLTERRYQVETIRDIADLDSDVTIFAYRNVWTNIVNSAKNDEKLSERLAKKSISYGVAYEHVMPQVQRGEAIYITVSATAAYINAMCPRGIRHIQIGTPMGFTLGINMSTHGHLLGRINQAISVLQGMFENIVNAYSRYHLPKAVVCELNLSTSIPPKSNSRAFPLESLRGHFMILGCGCAIAGALLLVEVWLLKAHYASQPLLYLFT